MGIGVCVESPAFYTEFRCKPVGSLSSGQRQRDRPAQDSRIWAVPSGPETGSRS